MLAPEQLFASICIMVGHKSISIDSLRRCSPNANRKEGFPVFGDGRLYVFPRRCIPLSWRAHRFFIAPRSLNVTNANTWLHFTVHWRRFPSRQYTVWQEALTTLLIWCSVTVHLSSSAAENAFVACQILPVFVFLSSTIIIFQYISERW